MYDNIGSKIKTLAIWSFVVEAFAAIIGGIAVLGDQGLGDGWWGLLILILGPIVAWVSSWVLYGFAEIIDTLCEIEHNTRGRERKSEERIKVENEKNSELPPLKRELPPLKRENKNGTLLPIKEEEINRKLLHLKDRYEFGLITKEEYLAKRAEIIKNS